MNQTKINHPIHCRGAVLTRPASKKYRNKKGITLISLVVTIIILLILAGITLALTAGSEGILGKASKAVDTNNQANAKEQTELLLMEKQSDYYDEKYVNQTYDDTKGAYILEKLKQEGTTQTQDYKIQASDSGTIYVYDKKGSQEIPIATGTLGEDGKIQWNDEIENTNPEKPTNPNPPENPGDKEEPPIDPTPVEPPLEDPKKATEAIKTNHYGDLADYSANGIEDWKIFYNDGTYIYLITSDYIPQEKVPAFQNQWSTYRDRFLATSYTLSANYENSKCVSTLLNTNNWSAFANGTSKGEAIGAGLAIGGPTLEMYAASWKEKGYKEIPKFPKAYGYDFSQNTASSTIDMSKKDSRGYKDTLYYPHTESWNGTSGYNLASPGAWNTSAIIRVVSNGWLNQVVYTSAGVACRPVVCLPNNIDAQKGRDEKWVFSKKEK